MLDSSTLAENKGLIPLIEALRSCFGGVEYMWISPSQQDIVAFVWQKELTEENLAAWAELAPGFDAEVAVAPAKQIIMHEEAAWAHGYHEQRLRHMAQDPARPFDWLLVDRPPMPEAAIPLGIVPMSMAEVQARFCFNERRGKLYSDLKLFLGILYLCFGKISSVWLGGSFISTKECPGDVDAYIFIKHETWEAARQEPKRARRAELLSKRHELKSQNLEVHFFICEEFEGELAQARMASQDPYSQWIRKRGDAISMLGSRQQTSINYERMSEPAALYGRGFVELVL